MIKTSSFAGLAAIALLSACGGSGETLYIGPNATPAQATAAIDALETTVENIFNAEGNTPYASLPGNTVSYSGLVSGEPIGGTGPAVNHAADLSLTVDYAGDTATGEIFNFVTTQPGFANPQGTVLLAGSVDDVFSVGVINATGTADISQGAITATYSIAMEVQIGGTDARAIGGGHVTELDWQTGPDAGTSSQSSGPALATRN